MIALGRRAVIAGIAAGVACSVAATATAFAESKAKPFLTHRELDLARYLPAPPAANSAATKAELEEVLAVQAARTQALVERAKADSEERISQFWGALGMPDGTVLSPRTTAFFDRVIATEGAVVDVVKRHFARLRPHMNEPKIEPVVRKSTSGSWPSGHATVGWLMAIVLADMVPEKRAALFDRASEYAESRLIGGIHHRSDLVVGRQSGALIAMTLAARRDFAHEARAARAEIRKRLGLSAQPSDKS